MPLSGTHFPSHVETKKNFNDYQLHCHLVPEMNWVTLFNSFRLFITSLHPLMVKNFRVEYGDNRGDDKFSKLLEIFLFVVQIYMVFKKGFCSI